MTLFEILITNHTGFPFYKWSNPNSPKHEVNVVKYSRFPLSSEGEVRKDFELECGYMAAMSLSARGQGMEVTSIKKKPIEICEESGMQKYDIIFNLTVDTYMNEKNLWNRIDRATDNIIFIQERKDLSDKKLEDAEKERLLNTFNDFKLRKYLNDKSHEIISSIANTLSSTKGEEKQLFEYGILGVGILSSSYNILSYNSVKSILGLKDEDLEYAGDIPEDIADLDMILATTEIPMNIEGGESKFAYPHEKEIQLIIHNLDVGPKILDVKEPYYLIILVRVGFPSKETIDDLIQTIIPILVD